MGMQPKINGKTVERSYEDYRNGIYLVKRVRFILLYKFRRSRRAWL